MDQKSPMEISPGNASTKVSDILTNLSRLSPVLYMYPSCANWGSNLVQKKEVKTTKHLLSHSGSFPAAHFKSSPNVETALIGILATLIGTYILSVKF